MQSTSIEIFESAGIDFDALQEEVQYEIQNWFEHVDFEFIIGRLLDKEILPEGSLEELKVYDEVYEVIEEEVGKIFRKE